MHFLLEKVDFRCNKCCYVSESSEIILSPRQENMLLREKVGLKSTEHVQQVMLLGLHSCGREDIPTQGSKNEVIIYLFFDCCYLSGEGSACCYMAFCGHSIFCQGSRFAWSMLHFCLQTVDTVMVPQCFLCQVCGDNSFVTWAVLQITKTVAVFVLLGENADIIYIYIKLKQKKWWMTNGFQVCREG